MRKKHQKYYRRMDKLLFQMMKVARKNNPVDGCAACCATLAILYKTLNTDQRETISPVIVQCINLVTGGGKQADERVH